MYRVGPKTSKLPLLGRAANSGAPIAMLQDTTTYCVFATFPTMSATPQFGIKLGPNLGPFQQYLKPDDQKRLPRANSVNKTPPPSHKVPRIMRAKAKKTPMCSASLTAIKLKGLAAPGEALKSTLVNEGLN